MKILVLVGSSTVPPYDDFMKVQQETWATVKHEDVEVLFYYADDKTGMINENTFTTKCDNDFYMSHWRFKLALDYVWEKQWDLIFRCHSSSYVNVNMLVEAVKNVPLSDLYTGHKVGGHGLGLLEWRGAMIKQICVSGAGILISRDVADIIRRNLNEDDAMEDDVLVGRLLQLHGVNRTEHGIDRIDIESMKDYALNFHYRFRTDDRQYDMDNMRLVHLIHSRL